MNDAAWALAGDITGGLISGIINFFLQKSQFKHNKEMFLLQNQSKEVVKSLLNEMLGPKSFTDRSFDALRAPIGGYSDDEVRQLLHEIKAKKTIRKENNSEWWYLLSREDERIKKKREKAHNNGHINS